MDQLNNAKKKGNNTNIGLNLLGQSNLASTNKLAGSVQVILSLYYLIV